MIDQMFYLREIDSSIEKYLYDTDYLIYYINKMLLQKGPLSIEDIKKLIKQKNGSSNLKSKEFQKFLSNFTKSCDYYYVNNDAVLILKKTVQFAYNFQFILLEAQEELFKRMCISIGQNQFSLEDSLPYVLAMQKLDQCYDQEYYDSLFFTNIIKYNENYRKLDCCVIEIDEGYKKLTVDFIFADKIVIDILFANGITTLSDLVFLSIDSLLLIFSSDVNYYISILSTLHKDFLSTYKNDIMSFLNQLEDKEKEIISLRNGFLEEDGKTLDEIGEIYGITRERIRQIEKKGMEKISSNFYLMNTIFASIYFNLIGKNDKYIVKEKLLDFIKDDYLAKFIILLISKDKWLIAYDLKLEIIYNRKVSSLDDIESETIDAYGDYVCIKDFELFNDFEKKVIKKNYRLVDDKVFVRKNVSKSILITYIIDDLFGDGYHISDKSSFTKIQNEYLKRYGYWDEGINARLVASYLERQDYCQISKGTYKNRKYVVNLNANLKDQIIHYLLENKPLIFYISIFEHFKKELEELGINNSYYLKGLLDCELPEDEEFTTKRNYIQIGETKISSTEIAIGYFRSFDTSFSFDEVKTRFEGVKDYVLYNYIYSEMDNGLIWISSKKFIYIDKVNISENTKKKLEDFLNFLFSSLNTDVIGSRKIFSKLLLTNKPLLDDLKIVTDHFSMFSLIRCLYSEKYYFKRPLIFVSKSSSRSQISIIIDYVSKLDKFNLNIIKVYQAKLSLMGFYSYLEFMEYMSDEFIQINIDTMMKKELLEINESFIKEFDDMFKLIFNKFDAVDTRTFNGYMLLPSLEHKRNKYLLAGIIRTYFNDKYEIENTNPFYNLTDFIIKKMNKGENAYE